MKYFSFINGLALCIFLVAKTNVFANPLEVELNGLLKAHPQIKAAEKGLESSRQEIGSALSTFLPTVTASGDVGYEEIDTPTTRSTQADGDWNRSKNVAGLTVSQNLFSGYSNTSAVRTARLNKEIARIAVETTRQDLILEGIQAYVDILRQRSLIDLARENEATIQRQLKLEDERVQRGSGITVDVLQAKSRLQLAKERRINFEGALEDAISRYIQTYNHPPNIDEMMDPIPPIELVPSELTAAIDIATNENPAIGNSGTSIEVARETRRLAQAELFPTVDLEGAMNYEKHNSGTLGTRRDYSVVVSASWDLFTGFSSRYSRAKASYDYQASKDDYEFSLRKVVEQTKLAWQALLTARERLELLENAVNIATEVFGSRKKLREAGKETVINVLDAENEVNNAQTNFNSATYDERVAVYQLLRAMGQLNKNNLALNY